MVGLLLWNPCSPKGLWCVYCSSCYGTLAPPRVCGVFIGLVAMEPLLPQGSVVCVGLVPMVCVGVYKFSFLNAIFFPSLTLSLFTSFLKDISPYL